MTAIQGEPGTGTPLTHTHTPHTPSHPHFTHTPTHLSPGSASPYSSRYGGVTVQPLILVGSVVSSNTTLASKIHSAIPRPAPQLRGGGGVKYTPTDNHEGREGKYTQAQ